MIFAELSEEQLWAIALTGIMTEVNNDSHFTLNSNPQRSSNVYLEVLRRDWGVTDKKELLDILDQMENDGHSIQLEQIKNIILEHNGDLDEIIKNYQFRSETEYYRLLFTLANWELYKNISIVSWDLGRNVALCRWGYDVGFLTELEAWEKIMYFAKRIQPFYRSWADYGYTYFLGRIFWASGFGSVERYVTPTEQIYRNLISETGHWNSLRWNVNLENR